MLTQDLTESFMDKASLSIIKICTKELLDLQKQHPEKRVMLIAEKGTMGVGSSRMSGVNNVALMDRKTSQSLYSICKYCSSSCRLKWNITYLF